MNVETIRQKGGNDLIRTSHVPCVLRELCHVGTTFYPTTLKGLLQRFLQILLVDHITIRLCVLLLSL